MELTIVIAVVAVVSVLIVTFCSLVMTRVGKTEAENAKARDLSAFEELLFDWVSEYDIDSFIASASGNELSFFDGTSAFTMSFDGGKLSLPGDEPILFDEIESVTFSVSDYSSPLILCRITLKSGEEYKFFKALRAAEAEVIP